MGGLRRMATVSLVATAVASVGAQDARPGEFVYKYPRGMVVRWAGDTVWQQGPGTNRMRVVFALDTVRFFVSRDGGPERSTTWAIRGDSAYEVLATDSARTSAPAVPLVMPKEQLTWLLNERQRLEGVQAFRERRRRSNP